MILNMKLNIRKMRSDNYSLNNVEKPLWNEWESNADKVLDYLRNN